MKAIVKWQDAMNFQGKSESDVWVPMGPMPKEGEEAKVPTPMDLVLIGLGGCQSLDVAWILNKKKIEFKDLWVELEAEKTEGHPKVFKKIHMKFVAVGDVPLKALEQAANLSIEKYCSVGAMIGQVAEITQEFEVRES